jgi:hypothetical protein
VRASEEAGGADNQENLGSGLISYSGDQDQHIGEQQEDSTLVFTNPLFEQATSSMAGLGSLSFGGKLDSGSSSSNSMIPKLWSGQPGVDSFGEWQRAVRWNQGQKRNAAMDKKLDKHSGEEIAEIAQLTVIRSDGAKAVEQAGQVLEKHVRAADQGWYPPQELEAAALEFVRKRHPNSDLAEQTLAALIKERYEKVHIAAVAKGWALEDSVGLEQALTANSSPLVQQQDSTGNSSGGGGGGLPPATTDPMQTAMLGFFKTLSDRLVKSTQDNKYFMTVGMRKWSPHSCVMELFWCMMDAAYGVASSKEQAEFYQLQSEGSQGSRQVQEFAQRVAVLYESVKTLGIVPAGADITTFCKGLSNASSRQFARQRKEEYYASNRTHIALESLADQVQQFEKNLHQDGVLAQQALIMVGNSSVGAGSSKNARRAGEESTLVQTLLRSRRENEATQQYLSKMGAREKLLITKGFDMAEIDPKDPSAVCLDCPATKRPHLNQDCKGRRMAGLAMAAAQEGSTANKSSSSIGSSAGTLDVNTLAIMVQQAVAMAAAGAGAAPAGLGQGLPRAYNKPENSRGNRGYGGSNGRQQQYAGPPGLGVGSAVMACVICGFAKGHSDGVCYMDKPELAPEKWEGPTERAPEQGMVHYISRCMQQKLKPRLGRCKELLRRMMQSNKLPPAMQQFIGQHTQQQRYMNMAYGAAAEPYGAYAAYMTGMGSAGSSYWPMGGSAMQQPMAGLPPSHTPLAITGAVGDSTGEQAAMMVLPDAGGYVSEEQQQETMHFGPSFCYVGLADWQQDLAGGLFDSTGHEYALVGTRAQAGAGAVQQGRVVRQPVPKGFLPPSALPTDLNAMRSMPRITNALVAGLGELDGTSRGLLHTLLDIQRFVASRVSAFGDLLGVQEAGGAHGSSSAQQGGQQALQEATAAKGTASMVSSSSSGRCGPVAAAAASSRSLLESVMLQYGFKPVAIDYTLRQSMPVTLDFLVGTNKQEGLTLTTPDGRDVLVDMAFQDSGATLLLFTEVACGEWGTYIFRTNQVPSVKGIDGLPSKKIIGRTGPLVLTLAKGHPLAAVLPVPCAWVLEGDAGGMFKVCLDKKTLLPVFGYVDPALNMLCFRPKAAQGRLDIIHGIPVRGYVKNGNSSISSGNMAAATIWEEDSRDTEELEGSAAAVPGINYRPFTAEENTLANAELERLLQAGVITELDAGPFEVNDRWYLDHLGLNGGVPQQVQEDLDSSSSTGSTAMPELCTGSDSDSLPELVDAYNPVTADIEYFSPHGSAADAWLQQQTGGEHNKRRRRRGRGRKGRGRQQQQQQQEQEQEQAEAQQPLEEPAGKLWGFDWSKAAGQLLPGISWITTHMVLLLLGMFHFFVDLPLRKYPSKIMRGLVSMAGAAVRPGNPMRAREYNVAEPVPTNNLGDTRRARKRRHNRGPRPGPGLQPTAEQDAPQTKVSVVATVRHSGKVITARTVLMCLLCFFSVLCSTAAMQVTNSIGAAATGSALQAGYFPLPHGVPPHLNMHLLQQELANLHCSRFRCYSRA